jgi:death-on-curing family protein
MKVEPVWIDECEILAFHEELLARFGGAAGIRDAGLLESALNRPHQLFHYGDPSLPEMAAAYGVGIVKNHPFLDGNKRTGFLAAALFLALKSSVPSIKSSVPSFKSVARQPRYLRPPSGRRTIRSCPGIPRSDRCDRRR